MPKTKGEQVKVEEVKQEQPIKETPPVEPQTPAPTQEDIDTRIAEALKKQDEEWQKKYQGLQKVINKKDRELSKRKAEPFREDTTDNTLKLWLQTKEQQEKASGEVDPMIPILRDELKKREWQAQQAKQMRDWQTAVDEQRESVIQQIEEAGLDPEDARFDPVWDKFEVAAYTTGDFSSVSKRLDRALKTIPPKPSEVKVEVKPEEKVEPQLTPEQLESIGRDYAVKKGWLKSPTDIPSGAGTRNFTREEIASMPIDEYMANKPDIEKARKEGRIK